ncbi:MAG: hypothetical protein M3Q06_15320 [Bacteroidota bacterium]|nr:hypothetical protein [Bacteroidota bacterium]
MEDYTDLQFLKDRYTAARNKYKPAHVKCLLLAEAPPSSLDRHFYFEDVKRQDSLFLEIMGVLYPEQKAAYLASGRDTESKKELLQRFRDDGFWLMDLSEIPCELSGSKLEDCLPSLLQRLHKTITPKTPVLLIKANIFDLCYQPLLSEGFNVCNERMPFPGSGQQRVFRQRFKKAIANL